MLYNITWLNIDQLNCEAIVPAAPKDSTSDISLSSAAPIPLSLSLSSVCLAISSSNSSSCSVLWFTFVCVWQGLWSCHMCHKLCLGCLWSAIIVSWVSEHTWTVMTFYWHILHITTTGGRRSGFHCVPVNNKLQM